MLTCGQGECCPGASECAIEACLWMLLNDLHRTGGLGGAAFAGLGWLAFGRLSEFASQDGAAGSLQVRQQSTGLSSMLLLLSC